MFANGFVQLLLNRRQSSAAGWAVQMGLLRRDLSVRGRTASKREYAPERTQTQTYARVIN